ASTLAVNVSATLAKKHQQCCLVDLHPGRGDLDGMLDVKPQFTLADLCLNQSRLDRAMFEKTLTRHDAGIHLLSAPPQWTDSRAVSPEGVSLALNMARKIYSHVVVDLEDCFHDEQVKVLQQTTHLLLVFRLEFAGLRNARRSLEHLDNLGVARRKIRLVANRFGQPNELPPDEVEEALGQKIAFYVPNDPKTANGAHNTGIPVVLKEPGCKLAQSLSELANLEADTRGATVVQGSKVLAFAH
ncbi:MAG TPA: hypothetical protein VE988_27655, partial [Gemmataceae bacterium]|nr:hypothetical protein [Gemmataceae bacterium]